MKNIFKLILLLLVFASGFGCTDNEKVFIQRFDRVVVDFPNMSRVDRDSALSLYSPVVSFMQHVTDVDNVDTLMCLLANSRAVAVFQPDIERLLPDVSSIEPSRRTSG